MILSSLETINSKYKPKLNGNIRKSQIVKLRCDICQREYTLNYNYVCDGREKYYKDLCYSCKMKEQYKRGYRSSNGWDFFNNRGDTLEKRVGEDRAREIKKKLSEKSSGKNNPMFGKNYQSYGLKRRAKEITGKSFEEQYGKEKSLEIKKKMSDSVSGNKNPMYGKPAPMGSGNGWSGWYKEHFFRSIRELSFIINVLEKNNIKWESAEQKKYSIPYADWDNKDRNYFADFILENKVIVEIKPDKISKSKNVLLKSKAATIWCKQHKLKYKLITDNDFNLLSIAQIKNLVDNKQIIWLEKYREKYERFIKIQE